MSEHRCPDCGGNELMSTGPYRCRCGEPAALADAVPLDGGPTYAELAAERFATPGPDGAR